jgi:hypothetical protein
MGISAKAEYLCATHQARSYAHACSLLAGMRKKKPAPPAGRQFWQDKD